MNGLRMPDGVTSRLTACPGGFLESEQGQISKKSHDKQRERDTRVQVGTVPTGQNAICCTHRSSEFFVPDGRAANVVRPFRKDNRKTGQTRGTQTADTHYATGHRKKDNGSVGM